MKKKIAITLALSLILSINYTTINLAASSDADDEKMIKKVESVSDISDFREELINENDADEVSIELDDASTLINTETEELEKLDITMEDEYDMDFSVSLDEGISQSIVDNVISIENEDYYSETEICDGLIRDSFVIENSDATEEYEIKFDFPSDCSLRFSCDVDGECDGSIEVVKDKTDIVMAISKPWARDANGKDIETYYKILGNTIIQVVRHKGDDTINYPIVADPSISFGTWFSSGKWGMNGSYRSLKLKPSLALRASGIMTYNGQPQCMLVSNAVVNASWASVVKKFSGTKYWKNASGLEKQYICHFYFAFFKNEFHLEPNRPNVSLAKTIKKKCNP